MDRGEIWNLLGMEKSADRKAIRRAYAAQAKLHHPEEEPEYFTLLNQAYKEALEYAASAGSSEAAEGKAGAGHAEAVRGKTRAGNVEVSEGNEGVGDEKAARGRTDAGNEEAAEDNEDAGHAEAAEGKAGAGNAEAAEGKAGAGNAEASEGNVGAGDAESANDSVFNMQHKLTDRLQSAETRRIQESLQSGSLKDFVTLFENTKRNRQADTWKQYFLTESFLSEQFSEEYGKGLLEYLKNQDIVPYDNLPMGLLQELAIAYAFIPHFAGEEYFEGKKYPKEWYKVSVDSDTPGARKYIAEIFNIQGVECDLKSMTNHILRQPALKVRHNAFSDYLILKEKNRNCLLTEGEGKSWKPLLRFAKSHHLYERNGKCPYDADGEARGECLIKLYVQWFKEEQIPECVLKFLYRELAFKELDRSSTKGLYRTLKEQALLQCPNLEALLFDGESKEQAVAKLYKACIRILNDNQTNYEKSIYEETPEIRGQVSAFFSMPEWQKYKEDETLFDKLCSALCRLVMPRSMAEYLAAHYAKGDFPEPRRSRLVESLLRSLSTEKMCREFDYKCEVKFDNTGVEGLGGDNAEFWQYFFQRGFGYRHVRAWNFSEEEADYEWDGETYLPAYIQYLYAPSKTWQKLFTGFDEECEAIKTPVSYKYTLADGKALRVEFHYHYCLYFLEEIQITESAFSFRELCRYAEGMERAEHFFFLLAVTAIAESERKEAEGLIEKWLEKVPVHAFTRPFLARLLAAGHDRVAPEKSGSTPDLQRAHAVYYMESERFCFRAEVSENSIKIYRQTDYGWEDKIFREKAFGWREFRLPDALQHRIDGLAPADDEGRRHAACEILDSLRQPTPVCRASLSLDGMEAKQKAALILEAMDLKSNPEGYCVLQYGGQRKKRHARVFYAAIAPFGFSVGAHSPAHARSLEYNMSVSRTKIKENKWLLGHFGWGFKYSTKSDFAPTSVWLGESGTYYACGAVRTYKADDLAALLAELYRGELEGVTAAETYEGCLTVSKLDHRLEYCYRSEDFLHSISCGEETGAEAFTLFGRYPLWKEFAAWMDGVLEKGLPSWVNLLLVGLDEENGGLLTFAGIHYEEETDGEEDGAEYEAGEEDDTEQDLWLDEAGTEAELNGADTEQSAGLNGKDTEQSAGLNGAGAEQGAEEYGTGSEKCGTAYGADNEEDDAAVEADAEEDGTGAEFGESCGMQADYQVYRPEIAPFFWEKDFDIRYREESLYNAVCWYMDGGAYAEALKESGVRIVLGRPF